MSKQAKPIQSIDDLLPDDRNANRGTERGATLIRKSLKDYGAGRSVLADRDGRLIAGNKTVENARAAGLDKVRVVQTDGSEIVVVQRTDLSLGDRKARELALVDNRAGQVSLEWDVPEVEAIAADFGIELGEVGFKDGELEKIGAGGGIGGEVTEDAVPDAADVEKRCNPGDLWLLGDHRLLCGDSTVKENVDRLLAGAKPFIMVTDPPYGVKYDPTWRDEAGGTFGDGKTVQRGKVQNDDRVDWTETYSLFPGDVAYVWHASFYTPEVGMNLKAAGFDIRASIIWKKQHFVLSQGHYHWHHEPCWYVVRKGAKAKWCGDRTQSTIWDIQSLNPAGGNKAEEKTGHGTQKPVECMARPIRNHGGKGDDVYDPFLGSGTTLIAAEQLGRRCFGMELAPEYCDIIIARWEKLTGKKATRAD